MPRGTFAIFRDDIQGLHNHGQMGIGEIAMVLYKANPETMGQVVDVSIGGVAFHAPSGMRADADELKLDLLMAEQGIYIHDIPFASVNHRMDSEAALKTDETTVKAVRFTEVRAYHHDQLKKILSHYVVQR